jgi:hypothetical protein
VYRVQSEASEVLRGGEWRICRVIEARILLHPDSVVDHVVEIIRLICSFISSFSKYYLENNVREIIFSFVMRCIHSDHFYSGRSTVSRPFLYQ